MGRAPVAVSAVQVEQHRAQGVSGVRCAGAVPDRAGAPGPCRHVGPGVDAAACEREASTRGDDLADAAGRPAADSRVPAPSAGRVHLTDATDGRAASGSRAATCRAEARDRLAAGDVVDRRRGAARPGICAGSASRDVVP